MEYFVIGAAVLGLVIIAMIFMRRRPKNAPPNAYLGLPLVGNYIEFAKNPVNFIARCLDKFGPIYTVPMLHKNLTFLLGPEVSAPFFRLNDDYMSQAEVYGFMTPVFGKGVVYDAEPKRRTQQYQVWIVYFFHGCFHPSHSLPLYVICSFRCIFSFSFLIVVFTRFFLRVWPRDYVPNV